MMVVLVSLAYHEPGDERIVSRPIRRVEVAIAVPMAERIDHPSLHRMAHQSEEPGRVEQPALKRHDQSGGDREVHEIGKRPGAAGEPPGRERPNGHPPRRYQEGP